MPPASTSVTDMEIDEVSATKQKIAKLEEKLEKLEQTVSTIEGPNPDYASLRSDQLYLALRTDLASLNQQVATLQVERCKSLVVLSVAAVSALSAALIWSATFPVELQKLQRQRAAVADAAGTRWHRFVACSLGE